MKQKIILIVLALILAATAYPLFNRLRYKHIMSPKEAKVIQVDYITGDITYFVKGNAYRVGNINQKTRPW